MARKLKALGLALVAVFAISAVASSAASAQNGIVTSDGPFTLKAVNTGEEKTNSLTAFGQVMTCPNATFTIHKVGVTPHEKIPNNSSAGTITPNMGVCKLEATVKATLDMNGCDLAAELTKTTAVADQYAVTTTVVCPTGKHVVVTLFTNETFHKENRSFCHITITEKASYEGLKQTDNTTTPNSFSLAGTFEGLEMHKEVIAGTAEDTPTILCPTETSTTGIFHLNLTITEASGTGIKLSHT